MKKVNLKAYNQTYKGFILIENISDLIDFRHEMTYGLMKESATTLVDRAETEQKGGSVSHATDAITNAVEKVNKIRPKGVIYAHAELMGNYTIDQDKIVSSGKSIAINPYNMVSYFTVPDDSEIEFVSLEEKYSVEDIKISRWDGGVHWYAKIGQIDVVIDNEQKWNARWVAQKKAEQYLKEM